MAQAPATGFLTLARQHLERALNAAQSDPPDWTDLSTYGFYGLEAAVMAAAVHAKVNVSRTHPGKAAAAEKLAADFGLPDVSGLLRELNTARKASAYGDIDFPELDAAEVAHKLDSFVDAFISFMKS